MACSNSKCSFVLVAVVGAALGVLGTQAFSQNTKSGDTKPAGNAPKMTEKSKDAMPAGMEGMPPEMAKYMQNMMSCGQPGPEHAEMAKMVGSWTFTAKMWMMPGTPEMTCSGTTTYKSIFGGRVLQGEMEGAGMMNGEKQSFQGMELMGFNNWTGKTWSFWVGSDCTAPWYGTGTHDEATKSCTLEGKAPNFFAAKGTMASSRSKMTMTDDNTGTFEMWAVGPDGNEFKNMEMTMTRKK